MKQMNVIPLHRGAVHEAGHAVVARRLRACLGRIRINRDDPSGDASTDVSWPSGTGRPLDRIYVAAAGAACLRAFGFDTHIDLGSLGDEAVIQTLLDELLPDEERAQELYRAEAIALVELWLEEPRMRAAVEALALELDRMGELEGLRAQEIIDPCLGR